MRTSGILGFRVGKEDKVTYVHKDSDPKNLGIKIVKDILKENNTTGHFDKWYESAKNIKLVIQSDIPTDEDIERFKDKADLNVGKKNLKDWYCLLHHTQESPRLILDAGVMLDFNAGLYNSKYCTWAYILNLNNQILEIYQGKQKEPHCRGRYAEIYTKPDDIKYYPVALVAEFDMYDVSKKDMRLLEKWIARDGAYKPPHLIEY